MVKARFEAELIEGHKGVTAVIVPFDPEGLWQCKPVKLEGRRHGWLVKGTVNGAPFESYIGDRGGRFFIVLEPALCETAKASVGDVVAMVVEPTSSARALAKARQQSVVTTSPGKARRDAIEKPPARGRRRS